MCNRQPTIGRPVDSGAPPRCALCSAGALDALRETHKYTVAPMREHAGPRARKTTTLRPKGSTFAAHRHVLVAERSNKGRFKDLRSYQPAAVRLISGESRDGFGKKPATARVRRRRDTAVSGSRSYSLQ